MTDWKTEIDDAIRDFLTVAALAHDPLPRTDIEVEYLAAPHVHPRLPPARMGVYGFWHGGVWLKIGKAGPNSRARYEYQHYKVGSAQSTLAASLVGDPRMATIDGFDPASVGDWIKASTSRVNILLPATRQPELLSLFEAFLHLRLRPRYEG